MVEKYPLRKCAEMCGIKWRHKILEALQNMMTEVELNGVVRDNETYSTISYKGNHKPFKPHPALKRVGKQESSVTEFCPPYILFSEIGRHGQSPGHTCVSGSLKK